MKTAVTQALKIDRQMIAARQTATMIVHELRDFIPDRCKSEAIYRLGKLFYDEGVEMTTAQSRRLSPL